MKKFKEMLNAIGDFLKKPVVMAIVILLIILLVFKESIIKLFNGAFGQGQDYGKLSENGAKISDSKAIELTERLYFAMSSSGTKMTVMYEVFDQLTNYGDYAKLYNVFGSRPYDSVWGTSAYSWWGQDLDLYGWMASELENDGGIQLFMNKYPDIFQG